MYSKNIIQRVPHAGFVQGLECAGKYLNLVRGPGKAWKITIHVFRISFSDAFVFLIHSIAVILQ